MAKLLASSFATGRGSLRGGGPKTNVPQTAELCNSAPMASIHPPTQPTRKYASRRSCPTFCRSVLLDSHPGGTNRGAEGGHRQNGKTDPPFVHKTLPVGNHAIWTTSATVTLCTHWVSMWLCTPTTSWMWFSDGRRTQSNNFPRFCHLGGLGGYESGGRMGAPPNRQNCPPPFVHKTLPLGNHAIWTTSKTVTLCAH